MNARPHQFKMLLSDDEKEWLEAIAASRGLTSSDVLRVYIREAYAALQTPTTRKKGKAER
jgi:Ribbon-helix-helix protein, copG family